MGPSPGSSAHRGGHETRGFRRLFSKAAAPEFSLLRVPELPPGRLAVSFRVFFFFKLGITTATIIMINSLVSKHFLKKSQ